ncbi:rab3 GTPase-activating protein catalytic subunit [Pelomyxa schiedti]|nr:rab3 GTPase-activating protein catalytic subunit [Pelomyxa schiedti]
MAGSDGATEDGWNFEIGEGEDLSLNSAAQPAVSSQTSSTETQSTTTSVTAQPPVVTPPEESATVLLSGSASVEKSAPAVAPNKYSSSSNVQKEESEQPFEILDFTCASPWEKFVSQIETILRSWKGSPVSDSCSQYVKWNGRSFSIEYRINSKVATPGTSLSTHINNMGLDFCANPLQRWFGTPEFLHVIPQDSASVSPCTNSQLISSFSIAAANCSWHTPIFVPYGPAAMFDYVGVSREEFKTAHFSSHTMQAAPYALRYLDGLLPFYFSKIGVSGTLPDKLHIRTLFTYLQIGGPPTLWRFPGHADDPTATTTGQLSPPLWGPIEDPVSNLRLQLEWQHTNPVTDNSSITEYTLDSAQHCYITCKFDDSLRCPLSRSVRALMLGVIDVTPFTSISQIINTTKQTSDSTLKAISRSISNTFNTTHIPMKQELEEIMLRVFSSTDNFTPVTYNRLDIQSAPPLSLPSILVLHMLRFPGLTGMLHIWREFVKQLRYHWESNLPLPSVTQSPELDCCLLYQKLQMLNYCRWYSNHFGNDTAKSNDVINGWDFGADLESHDTPRLLLTGEPIVAPVTQETGVMTEDMITEYESVLSRLGTSMEGSRLRARMQSASLLSDMQAFKAANPGSMLEDFVRWHSPNDWIPDGSGGGHLSSRMTGSTQNLWRSVWEEAQPLPVCKQPPLFDCKKEAAKVLHYFETITPSDLLKQLLGIIFTTLHHFFTTPPSFELQDELNSAHEAYTGNYTAVKNRAAAFEDSVRRLWKSPTNPSSDYEAIWLALGSLELTAARAVSLIHKLGSLTAVVESLLLTNNCALTSSSESSEVITSFKNVEGKMPDAEQYEFLVRCETPGHVPHTTLMHRFYAAVIPSTFAPTTVRVAYSYL